MILMELYLYDPKTNVSTKTDHKSLIGMTGMSFSGLSRARKNGSRLRVIGCYLTEGIAPLKQRQAWYANETYEDEAWMPLKNTKGNYLVSNYGRVQRIYKTTTRFMLPYQRKGEGNLWVKIDGKERKVGHLVAELYLRKWGAHERVTRKNGIVTDDYAGNLEIVSMEVLGKRTGFKSKSMPVVQICEESGELINEFRSAREAARNYFLSYQAILDRCNGVYSQGDGYVWLFAKDYYGEKKSLKIS